MSRARVRALQIAWEVVKACYMTLMRDSENLKKALGEDKPSAPAPGVSAAGPAAGASAAGTGPALAVRRAPASKAGFQQVREVFVSIWGDGRGRVFCFLSLCMSAPASDVCVFLRTLNCEAAASLYACAFRGRGGGGGECVCVGWGWGGVGGGQAWGGG